MSKASRLKQRTRESSLAARATGGFVVSPVSVLELKKGTWLKALVIVVAGLWVFWPGVRGQWIADDGWYIAGNPLMNDPARIWKAWFQPGSWVEYYPLEETVQYYQWQLWHDNTFGYHLTNILLHLASALLVWRLLAKFGLRLAWLGGLIFAVHPMVVDSVALINELKTSLSLPPFLLALMAWMDYEDKGRPRDYALALAFFIVAMLCKITVAMFPFVILLFAWWKRGAIGWRDSKASAPFFAVSLFLGVMTIRAADIYSHSGPVYANDTPIGNLLWRWVLAGENIAFYFSRCFLPVTPLAFYPRWKVDPSAPAQYVPWLVLAGVLCFLWTKRKGWGRHGLLGVGFFLIMLAPFWGLNWISYMNFTWVLDHLLYVPILGLIGLVIAGIDGVGRELPPSLRPFGMGLVAVVIGWLAWNSHAYASMFTDEATLAAYNVRYDPGSSAMHNNLGFALANEGRLPEALEQFQIAFRLDPQAANCSENLGDVLLGLGRVQDSLRQQEITVKLRPAWPQAHISLGNSLKSAGRGNEAIAEYEEAVRIEPSSAWMHYYLGLELRRNNRLPEAIEQYREALAIKPSYADAHNSLAIALYALGRTDEAREHFEQALKIDPDNKNARDNLARLQVTPLAPLNQK
jgi:Flp pilus assembly protein TadD